jgi:hypothetical protein
MDQFRINKFFRLYRRKKSPIMVELFAPTPNGLMKIYVLLSPKHSPNEIWAEIRNSLFNRMCTTGSCRAGLDLNAKLRKLSTPEVAFKIEKLVSQIR